MSILADHPPTPSLVWQPAGETPPYGAIKGEPKNPAYSSGHIGDSATAIVRSLDSLDPPQLEIGPFVKGSRDTLWCSEWVQSNGLRACRPVATVCVS